MACEFHEELLVLCNYRAKTGVGRPLCSAVRK
jgi:hypothetical protein